MHAALHLEGQQQNGPKQEDADSLALSHLVDRTAGEAKNREGQCRWRGAGIGLIFIDM